jgi:hypothetical protein
MALPIPELPAQREESAAWAASGRRSNRPLFHVKHSRPVTSLYVILEASVASCPGSPCHDGAEDLGRK